MGADDFIKKAVSPSACSWQRVKAVLGAAPAAKEAGVKAAGQPSRSLERGQLVMDQETPHLHLEGRAGDP